MPGLLICVFRNTPCSDRMHCTEIQQEGCTDCLFVLLELEFQFTVTRGIFYSVLLHYCVEDGFKTTVYNKLLIFSGSSAAYFSMI